MVVLSSFGWVFGLCAPIYSIIILQYLRIKHLSNHFTKNSITEIESIIENSLPSIVYSSIYKPLRIVIVRLLLFGQPDIENIKKKKQEADEKLKKESQERDGSEDEGEEPRTYEIGSDEDEASARKRAKKGQRKTYEV